MLTSLVMTLETESGVRLPASLGRAVNAALLRWLESRDARLMAVLHDDDGPRPFTASNLVMGRRQAGSVAIEAGQQGWVRYTGLNETVSRHLLALNDTPPAQWELDGHPFQITATTLNPAENGWAGNISYQDFAAPFLLAQNANPNHRISLNFVSPTTFRSQGRYIPLPQSNLVFRSLFNRWQAFAPVALNPEIRRFADEAVALSRFKIESRSLPYKQGGHVGFVGQATFVALNRDRYWLNMLQLLAAFAFYSGVGCQTAAGLGQTRLGKK